MKKHTKDISLNKLILFCGAGISYDSGVPLVNEIVTSTLEHIGCDEECAQKILKANIPFEAFFETLINNVNGERLFPIFEIGEPNTNHFFIANLAKEGLLQAVVTTNFDKLIEKACQSLNVEYEVIYEEKSLSMINWNDKKFRIIKLHGSIDNKEKMAITIKKVASNNLVEERHSVLEYIFSNGDHDSVMILGYSFSDVFDIVPIIKKLKKYKNIFVVEHKYLVKKDDATIEQINHRKTNNPFRNYPGARYYIDTNHLIKDLWKEVLKIKYKEVRHG